MNRFLVWTILVYLTLGCFWVVSASEKDHEVKGKAVSIPGERDLVGVWKFKDTDAHVLLADNLKDFLRVQGMDSVQAETMSNTMLPILEDFFIEMSEGMERRFYADNTWQNKIGDKGTWRIDGDKLVVTIDEDFVFRYGCFLDGDNLTLTISGAQLLDLAKQSSESSGADTAMFDNFIKETDVVNIVFTSGSSNETDIFGLKKGMSISEIRALGFGDLEEQVEGVYAQFNPKVPIGALNATFVVLPSGGLVKVLFSFEVKADEYGFKIREKYEELRDLLEWKYGKGVEQNFLRPDADFMLKDPPFYMMALAKGARVLSWTKGFILDNRWQLQAVGVKVEGIDFNTGMVIVIYEFDGFEKYIDKQKSGF